MNRQVNRLLAPAAALIVALSAGAARHDSAVAATGPLPGAVSLSAGDVPHGFSLTGRHQDTVAHLAKLTRVSTSTLRDHGLVASETVTYALKKSAPNTGVVRYTATVTTFADAGGAQWYFLRLSSQMQRALKAAHNYQKLDVPQIGGATAAFRSRASSGGRNLTVDTDLFNQDTYVVTLRLASAAGTLSSSQLIRSVEKPALTIEHRILTVEFQNHATISNIPCGTEYPLYHVHAHLTVLISGTPVTVPSQTGIHQNPVCYYWLHTHDTSGVIHVEAPTPVPDNLALLDLGHFFDIWGQCLSTTCAAGAMGQEKVYVDMKPYAGDPRAIQLHNHTDVTIEIGAPFLPPQPYNFQF